MRKYGFKIFTSNLRNNPKIFDDMKKFVELHKNRMFVEFMIVPDITKDELKFLEEKFSDIEVRIHAPHHLLGFDVGDKSLESQNRRIFERVRHAADVLNAKTIVVHPACKDDIETRKETVKQFKLFDDKRIVVENLLGNMSGNVPEEILYIKEQCGCGFCFDFSHAICAANSLKIEIENQLKGFFALKPDVYHVCDGHVDSTEDKHLHYGEGNYPLAHFLNNYTDDNAYISMETGQGVPTGIEPWIKDFEFMLKIEK